MLVFGQAVFLLPSPTPFPPIFLLNLSNMAPEIEFASSNFPPSHKTASYTGYENQVHSWGTGDYFLAAKEFRIIKYLTQTKCKVRSFKLNAPIIHIALNTALLEKHHFSKRQCLQICDFRYAVYLLSTVIKGLCELCHPFSPMAV